MAVERIHVAKINDGIIITFSDGMELSLSVQDYQELLAGIVAKECKGCPRVVARSNLVFCLSVYEAF